MINFILGIVLVIGTVLPSSTPTDTVNIDRASSQYIHNLASVESLNQSLDSKGTGVNVVFELTETTQLNNLLKEAQAYLDEKDLDKTKLVGNVKAVERNYEKLEQLVKEHSLTNKYVVFTDVSKQDYKKFSKGSISVSDLKKRSEKVVVKSEETMLFTDSDKFVQVTYPLKTEVAQEFRESFDKIDKSLDRIADITELEVEVTQVSKLTEKELELIKEFLPRDTYIFEKMKKITEDMPSLAEYSNGRIGEEMLCELPFASGYKSYCAMKDALVLLNEDYKKEFGTDLSIVSAYRDYDLQSYLYADSGGSGFVAPPGQSLHGAGLAIDVGRAGGGFLKGDDPTKAWLDENGYKYGLMQKEWQSPTSSTPEPWHYEFFTVVEETGGLALITKEPTLRDIQVELPKS